MRNYDLVCVIHPDLDEAAFTGTVDKVKGWITDAGGSIEKVDLWGRRRLAYAIQKQREGQYVYFQVKMDPKSTADLDRNLRFFEPVMRFIVVAQD